MGTEIKVGQTFKSKRPLRWAIIKVLAVLDDYIVYTCKDSHPFVYTNSDFKELLKDCQYQVQ